MGTGVLSTLLNTLPYNGIWLYWISVVMFVLNLTIFLVVSSLSLLRYFFYPEAWRIVLNHPVQAFSLAAIPMAFATVENMTVLVCMPIWGHWAETLAWIMWWIDVVLSCASCFFLTFEM
jgi:tellurite resistance protein TehA-like permease